jgi:putative DNA primase/helicase
VLEPVRWLWPGFLPAAMLTILGGAPGCGKTTIALSLAAIVTSGGAWPGGSRGNAPGDVVIWSGEDAHAVLAARLVAMGADMRRVHFIDGITGSEGEAFDPGRDMPLLEATAERLAAPRLLILDPIVSAVAGDSHKGAEVRRSLQPVVALAQRLGCAVIGITHFSKGTAGSDPAERITGSIAFAALARLVLVAAKVKAGDDGEARRVLVRAKSNIGPDDGGFAYSLDRVDVMPDVEGQRVLWLEALQGSAREVLAEAESDPGGSDESSALAEAVQFLRSELRDGSKPAKLIFREAHDAGHSERTIKRAKAELHVEAIKEKAGWVWVLPTKEAKEAKEANRANNFKAQPLGPVADDAKGASDSPLENLGPLGTLGPLADDSEVL